MELGVLVAVRPIVISDEKCEVLVDVGLLVNVKNARQSGNVDIGGGYW